MIDSLRRMLEQILDGRDLSEAQAGELLRALTSPDVPPPLAGAFLAGLRAKGVVADEVRGFAQAMRELGRRPDFEAGLPAIDIVGTGGDASGSLNLSTGAALLSAACGLRVVKHGNRSVSSKAGSADVLEALGLKLPLDETRAGECLAATGFTFLFAPHYHPAMKSVAPIRQAMGVRTVFNILGPLSNPAEPEYHVIGAFDAATAELLIRGQGISGVGGMQVVAYGQWCRGLNSCLLPFTQPKIGRRLTGDDIHLYQSDSCRVECQRSPYPIRLPITRIKLIIPIPVVDHSVWHS